jgi:hypothetical protein
MIVLFGGILGGDGWLLNRQPDFLKKPVNNRKKSKNHSIGESESEKTTKPQKFQQFPAWQKKIKK